MKEEITDRILKIGVSLIAKKGYHAVGLNEILQTANIPKGSFYYYFKNKEDFGLQVIEKFSADGLVGLDIALGDSSKNCKERIIQFFQDVNKLYTDKDFKEGCLLGNSSIELADKSDTFATVVNKELKKFEDRFETVVKEGQEEGSIKSDKTPKDVADFIVTNWHGALLRMKSAKNTDSLGTFIKFLEEGIL